MIWYQNAAVSWLLPPFFPDLHTLVSCEQTTVCRFNFKTDNQRLSGITLLTFETSTSLFPSAFEQKRI